MEEMSPLKISEKENSVDSIPARADLFLKLIHSKFEGESRLEKFLNDPKKNEIQQPPLSVELIAPIFCQQNCFYCSAGFVRENDSKFYNEKSILPISLEKRSKMARVLDTVDELADLGIKGAVWTGGGDWTVYPWFTKVLKHAKEFGISSMWITHLASKEYKADEIKTIIDSCDSIRISIDGHNKKIYNKIRQPSNSSAFEAMTKNIQSLVKYREKVNSPCHLGIQMVLCNENLETIPSMVKLAETLKVDYIQIRPVELRGTHSSKLESKVVDAGLQKYEGIYNLSQLDYAGKVCGKLAKTSLVDILFRQDKINNISPDDFEAQTGRKTQRCAGSHFQMVVSFNNLLRPMLRHCYFRHDLESTPFSKGNLRKLLYSKARSDMFKLADKSPLKCSPGCKYADCNQKIEQLCSKSVKESIEEVKLLTLTKVELVNPNII